MTADLAGFLLARITEDEAVARRVVEYQGNAGGSWTVGSIETFVGATWLAEHIARHDPARVLAECAFKREIVRLWNETVEGTYGDQGPQIAAEAVYALAAVYADHPDYRPAWRP